MMQITKSINFCLLLPLAVLLGCGVETSVDDPGVTMKRDAFLLNAKPASATTLEKAQQGLDQESSVVVEGWADLKYFESKKNQAIFMVREILDDNDHGGEGHDPSTCPFCKRRMEAAPKAAVVFTDEAARVIQMPIDKLFDVKHGDKVFVRGEGKLDKNLDLFKITASNIHIPRTD